MTPFAISLLVLSALLGIVAGVFTARRLVVHIRGIMIPIDNSTEIIEKARRRKEGAVEAAISATRDHLESEFQRIEEERAVVTRIQENFEQELNRRQSELDCRGNVVAQTEIDLEAQVTQVSEMQSMVEQTHRALGDVHEEYLQELESRSGILRSDLAGDLAKEILNSQRLAVSRWQIDSLTEARADSDRLGTETLWSIIFRYSSRIVWPKPSAALEIARKDLADKFLTPGSVLMSALLDGTGISADLSLGESSDPATLRLSGGAGIEREIIRLTADELISRQVFVVDDVLKIRDKYREVIGNTCLRMGKEAVQSLQIRAPMDPELMRLIGSLNYRTSHRQNQYFHSVEVATLAGMLAGELGEDPETVKRAGLLHDIGKSLDYRIEGSHAVISGDYASRYGESADVVDTVLAHHDDKIVETTAAYILKAADAMSGARPGARAEMEEGFQKRIDAISSVIRSFEGRGVVDSAIMHAGREIHVFVDNRVLSEDETRDLAKQIAGKLELDVEYPGQIRVTVVRRTEVVEVA